MLSVLIQKELRGIILSSKFTVTFTVCSLLLIMSVLIGINEYKQAVIQYDTVHEMAEERLRQVSTWHGVTYREHRKPSPLQIFSSGLSYDIGRWSDIDNNSSVKMKSSIYSDDPIFAVFRILDFTFIVQVVFSLLAILFTFDAVNGEKENGTLRLVFANAVSRTKYIMAKSIGSWLGLIVPILIPVFISLLLVVLFKVPMAVSDWLRLSLLIGVSVLYITLFIVLGVFVSTITKRSNVSFLLSLVFWIAFVLIIPRGGVIAAGHIISVPGLAEVEGWRDAFAKNKWEEYYRDSENRWRESRTDNSGENDEINEDAMWARMQVEDSIRKDVTGEIEKYGVTLMEDWQNKQRDQQRLGFILARISPAATYQLAAMTLANTDINIKTSYETAFNDYRTTFNDYVDEKSEQAGPGAGAVMITMDSEKGMSLKMGRESAIDVSDRPRFVHPNIDLGKIFPDFAINIAILMFMTIVILAGAFLSFLRFDLR